MNEHFTERATQALAGARAEARELRHTYTGTEHLLLAVLRERDGPAATALVAAGVTHAQVRGAVVRMMGRGVEDPGAELPLTSAAEHVIERAQRLSAAEPAGSEHILLALLEAQDGAAARILLQLDADPAAIRTALGGA